MIRGSEIYQRLYRGVFADSRLRKALALALGLQYIGTRTFWGERIRPVDQSTISPLSRALQQSLVTDLWSPAFHLHTLLKVAPDDRRV